MDWDAEMIGLMCRLRRNPPCPSCPSAAPVRLRRRAAPHAPPLPALALRGKGRGAGSRRRPATHAGRGRHGRFSRRDRCRVRRDTGLVRRASFRLSAPVSVFAPARHARPGRCTPSGPFLPQRSRSEWRRCAHWLPKRVSRTAGDSSAANWMPSRCTPPRIWPWLVARPRSLRIFCLSRSRDISPPTGWSACSVSGLNAEGRAAGRRFESRCEPLVQPSQASAILSVRSCTRCDSGRPRWRGATNLGGAPSHSTNVLQSPLSASTTVFAPVKSASSTKTANRWASCRPLRH